MSPGGLTVFTESVFIEELSWWTHAASERGIIDQSPGSVTDALSRTVDDETEIFPARNAVAFLIKSMPRWAHTFLLFVQDESPAGWTYLDRGAFPRGVTLVAREADAGHTADGQRVQNGALGVQAARLRQGTRV